MDSQTLKAFFLKCFTNYLTKFKRCVHNSEYDQCLNEFIVSMNKNVPYCKKNLKLK